MTTAPFCVCVPARDEATRLPVLLDALARQDVTGRIAVAVCINNSSDDSAAIVAEAGLAMVGRLDISVTVRDFAPADAHAGSARRAAMALGLDAIRDDGLLISTDADCRPPTGWLSATLAAIGRGADLVGGRIVLDEDEPLASAVAAARRRWDAYWEAVRAIEDAIDPCDWDPAPRHGDHTGASLAIVAPAYRAAGGVPTIPCGEDRALVDAARSLGAVLVHPDSVWTRVSPRRDGRAAGGMAEDMARLEAVATRGGVAMAPDFAHWRDRAHWRRAVRAHHGIAAMLAAEACLPPMPCDMPLEDAPAEREAVAA